MLLAFDTSTHHASVALCSADKLCGEYTWYVRNNHSVELLGCIQHLMAECNVTMQQLEGIAVATGPGSFNGLRVALATAKALAFALNKPLVGMSTLDTIAAQQQHWQGPICAVLEAGRSELYAACYMLDTISYSHSNVMHRMRQLSDYLLLAPQQLASYVQEQAWTDMPERSPVLFCGEISVLSCQALHEHMKEQSLFITHVIRHASVLARLALQRLQEGKEDNPLLLEPLYLRRPSITMSTRKQLLLGGNCQRSSTETEREEGALRR